MSTSSDSAQRALDQQHRNLAHGRLKDWASSRSVDLEALGWPGISLTERMRERAHGGDVSTRPARLTMVEADVARAGRTLQTELAVRDLPETQREAVFAKYVEHRTLSVWAKERGIGSSAVSERLKGALIAVGKQLRAARKPRGSRDPEPPTARRSGGRRELAILAATPDTWAYALRTAQEPS
jgi:hypothetical protein